MNFKKNGKVFTSKFVGTGSSSYEKRIYRTAVSQSLRNTDLVDTGAVIPELSRRVVNRTTRFHDVPRLRIYGDIPLFLCIASWRRAYFSRGANCLRINRIPT